jgi:hypothetical protein
MWDSDALMSAFQQLHLTDGLSRERPRVIVVSRDAKRYTDTVALEILDTNGNVIVTAAARASRVAWNEWGKDWSEWKAMIVNESQ